MHCLKLGIRIVAVVLIGYDNSLFFIVNHGFMFCEKFRYREVVDL